MVNDAERPKSPANNSILVRDMLARAVLSSATGQISPASWSLQANTRSAVAVDSFLPLHDASQATLQIGASLYGVDKFILQKRLVVAGHFQIFVTKHLLD